MFKRGNKCSQLNYLRSKTKLIRQQYNEAAVSRPASLVMLSSLSSAVNVAERGEGGAATVLTALKPSSLSWWREGTARAKRCWSHVCNEGVLCRNDSALSLSSAQSATMILQFSDPDFLFEKSLLVTGDQLSQLSTELWSGGLMSGEPSSAPCHAPPGGCHPVDDGAELCLAQDARLLPGAGPGLSDYVLQSYKSVGTPSVLRPCHTSPPLPPPLSRLSLTTGCGFLWKTNSTIFQLELAKILALCKFGH